MHKIIAAIIAINLIYSMTPSLVLAEDTPAIKEMKKLAEELRAKGEYEKAKNAEERAKELEQIQDLEIFKSDE